MRDIPSAECDYTDRKRAIQVYGTSRSEQQPPSPLLSLPPELRNRIYKCCLIADDENDTEFPMYSCERGAFILITKELKPPALLAVCREVRKETIGIFYLSNSFHVRATNYDASLYFAWRRHLKTLSSRKLAAQIVLVNISGDPMWDNLQNWCKGVWSGLREMTTRGQQHISAKHQIVDAAHRIAVAARGKPWVECEHQLEGLRMVLGQVDKRWLD